MLNKLLLMKLINIEIPKNTYVAARVDKEGIVRATSPFGSEAHCGTTEELVNSVCNKYHLLELETDELQRKIERLERELYSLKQGENLSPYSHKGMMFCEVSGQPKSDCSCPDCWPEGQESDNVDHDY